MEKVVDFLTTFSYHKYLACLTKLLKISIINRVSKLNHTHLFQDFVFDTSFRTDKYGWNIKIREVKEYSQKVRF